MFRKRPGSLPGPSAAGSGRLPAFRLSAVRDSLPVRQRARVVISAWALFSSIKGAAVAVHMPGVLFAAEAFRYRR